MASDMRRRGAVQHVKPQARRGLVLMPHAMTAQADMNSRSRAGPAGCAVRGTAAPG